LTHFTPEHFQEHFINASRGTIMEEAKLVIVLDTNSGDPHALDIILESIEVE
jgi:hydrogenase nickel incorporation protein HypA/HybF